MPWNFDFAEALDRCRRLGGPADQQALLTLLQEVQEHCGGALPMEALRGNCLRLFPSGLFPVRHGPAVPQSAAGGCCAPADRLLRTAMRRSAPGELCRTHIRCQVRRLQLQRRLSI